MYTNDKSFSFRDLIIKIIFLGLFVALLVWLFPKVSMKPFYSNVFRENISYMQEASKSYFTTDKLPTELYTSTKLTLKEMEDKNLIIPFIDKDGNSCNVNESYAEVTKETNGYKLRVQLTCNTESDFIVEILGCYDYGCDSCSSSNENIIEYEFKREFSKKITTITCPSGYSKDGNNCYKILDKVTAKENYTDGYNLYYSILYKDGEVTKTLLKTDVSYSTVQTKKYIARSERTVDVVENVCTENNVPDPNCSVQCKWKIVGGEYKLACNTCGTITVKSCSDQVTGSNTEYYCSRGYREGDGASLKCYVLEESTVTSYSCPNGTTEHTGDKETLKCYKTEVGPKTPYCENPKAQVNISLNKCVLGVGSEFSHYSCPSKDYTLDAKNKLCVKTDKQSVTKGSYTKKWSETKWSTSKTLLGWTATGKTRIVEVK